MYDNAADTNRYLSGSVVYWDGQPGYVSDARGAGGDGIQVFFAPLPYGNADGSWVNINDPRFNPFKFQLGYFNCKDNRARFLSRRPARIQSQGLCAGNTIIREADGVYDGARRQWSFKDVIRDPGCVDMMTGRYPTLAEAQERLANDKKVQSVAFDRDFCVIRHPNLSNLFFLCYRGQQVAFSGDFQFALPDEFQYLTEVCAPKGCIKKVA